MQLTFLGAAMIVTGSSYLLEVNDRKILIDCGMFQGSKAIRAFNTREFMYNPAELDCVVLTHAHIDHSGLLPRLCKEGFKGSIHATKVTADLCGIMLPDSAHIQEFDAEIANRKGKRAGKKVVTPLYTVEDAYACLKQFAPHQYDQELSITPEIVIKFRDAGHILGSAMVEVWVTEEGKPTKLVFSGDVGQPGQPIIKDPTFIEDADYVVIESTYGNRDHEPFDREETLAEIINDTVERGGNIVIPAFAVGRTQTILYYLRKLFKAGKIPDMPVIIDSPLAISATDIFMHNTQVYDEEAYSLVYDDKENPLYMPQLTFTRTAAESKLINTMKESVIIISASGMADAGRILHHLKHNLWRTDSSVLLVGYQAEGSLGRRLTEGAKKVKILGEEITVKAKVINLDGFSAHGDRTYLLEWLSRFSGKPANVFLVHGEPDMSGPFAERIEAQLGLTTYIPHFGDSALIDGRQWQVEKSQIVTVEPSVQQLRDSLAQLEAEYTGYRQRLEQLVTGDAAKSNDILRRIDKISSFIKKNLGDL